MGNFFSRRKKRLPPNSKPSHTSNLDNIEALSASDPGPECTEQEQGSMTSTSPSFSPSPAHSDENGEIVITSIKATDVAFGLRRVPVGFYIVVQHSGLEWRTENKRSSVTNDLTEWRGPFAIPSDLSATVRLEIYASFELEPSLGNGEQLRELTITVGQLLDHSANDLPFRFFPLDGDVVSPCSSLSITVSRRKCEIRELSASKALHSHRSKAESRSHLEISTDEGHSALSRYRKRGGKWDLERSIEQFEHALDTCPLNHPCRAAAQSNLAMAKFILCQVDQTDVLVDAVLGLYHSALSARPVGHVDRPLTLIQLAFVYFARFEKRRNEADVTQAEALLHEVIGLVPLDSHENQAASGMLQLYPGRKTAPVEPHSQSTIPRDSAPSFKDGDPWTSSVQLLERYEQLRDLGDLQQAIVQFETLVKSTSLLHPRYPAALQHFGVALFYRFCHLGELNDIEHAISSLRDSVEVTPDGHRDKPRWLNNLGNSFLTRFERLGELGDLERAISRLSDAVVLTPDGHSHKLVVLNSLGNSFLARFSRLGDLADLERAISRQKDAIDLTPDGHPHKPGLLNSLGNSLLTRFQHLGERGDLERAISTREEAAELTPDGHPDKPGHMNNLSTSFRARFKLLGGLGDLERAISTQKHAVELTPDDHPDKPPRLGNLGNSLFARFEHVGEMGDLEQAISMQTKAVELTPDGHPHKPVLLNNLGNSFSTHFEHFGGLDNLERAISSLSIAVELTPDGHPHKPTRLSNLGNSFFTRFEYLGELVDLERAISTRKEAVEVTPDCHPDKPAMVNNLGISFLTRFKRLGELNDLERAISMHKYVVEQTPDGHPDKPPRLSDLGNSFLTRFQHVGEMGDLEQAISMQTKAVELTPDGHPHKPVLLNNLGNSFSTHFEHFGGLGNLERAISSLSNAVELTPDGHPGKPGHLNNLGISFRTRFERLGELDDLERAIFAQKNAVELTPDHHPETPFRLNTLGNSFRCRFERLGDLGDLEQAIVKFRDTVELIPDGHPHKPAFLNNLGNSFATRFERLRELGDLKRAISSLTDAVELTPDGHPHKPRWLNSLGNSFAARFEHLGELGDLEHAISKQKEAVDLTSDVHPDRPTLLNNLGTSFRTRFGRLGELSDLEEAISRFRDGVELTPDGHPDKPGWLNNLGISLITRFNRLGELGDLEQAILRQTESVEITPDDHPDKPGQLSNLGISFRTSFKCLGELGDLERAISMQKHAIELIPDGHPHKPPLLNNLGNSFSTRFEHLGELGDLEGAMSTQNHAVELTPDGHPDKPGQLRNLGNSFLTRFRRIGELADLEQAISRLRSAVELTPEGHPDKPALLNNLGSSLVTRFDQLGELGDLERAISSYSLSASSSTGSATVRFDASVRWISCARASAHHSLFRAYSTAVGVLPQLAWIGLSLPHRFSELMQGTDVVREAAAAALDAGLPETAVEWLEQGRSIVWGELYQLRSSYDELSAVHPSHAHRLRELSAQLDQAGATREQSSSLNMTKGAKNGSEESSEQVANRHRALAIQRDKLLQEIRELPGFERFLLQKEYNLLCASAHSGPIVILNAADSRCDALIVLADVENVIHVPLPNFNLERCEAVQAAMRSLVRDAHTIPLGERVGQGIPQGLASQWESILSSLWQCVVKQVLDSLAFVVPGKQLRIFWCPTGPFTFLPIHAAGFYHTEYSQHGHKVFDFVVSSYVPTLSILAPSADAHVISSNGLGFLTVRQPLSDGQSRLPGVDAELKCIQELISNSPLAKTTLLESSSGTVEEVLDLMREADWVHFACHGVQDAANPTESGLCLADGRRLKLSNIITLSRPRGGLAFLSACQTATGDRQLSDEAIHMAAGMLFAGYGGVIGTMWSISDRLAPEVAKSVYEQLFEKDTKPDYREAARALQYAVQCLREGGASFFDWLPFIHVGL